MGISEVTPEQNRYANIVLVCSWIGIIAMAITFILYICGFLNPVVKPWDMPLYWGLKVTKFRAATHAPDGWGWMGMLNHSDYLGLIGLAFLGTISTLGYLALLRDYLLKKDIPYVILIALEIFVIVLAASGIFGISGG
jgi:hypothetical protein